VQKPFDVEQLLLTIQRAVEKRAAEIALRESEKRYQALTETSPVGIFRTDVNGATTYVNPRWCEISGLPAGQALGDGWLRAVHPEDRQKLTSGWQEATRAGRVSTAEYRFLRPDGTVVWVLGQAAPETSLSGEITGYIGTITDITESKLAEDALRASEARYRALVEKLPAIVYIDDATAEPGHTLYISPSIETILGIRAEEWLREGLDVWADRIHPDDRQRTVAAYLHAFESGQPFDCEYRLAAADGRMVWFRDQAVLLRDDKGQPRWFQGVMYDITERKRMEQSLRESEERFRSLFERMLDGVYRSTHEGRFVEINPAMARMFGYASREEMLKIDIKKELYFSPEERGSHLLDTGQEEIDVYRMRRKDGSGIWVEDRGSYVHDEQGNIIYHEGILRDVTERKQAEQALRESEERHRVLFEESPISLWEEDFSAVKERLERLRRRGVKDFRAYFRSHPQAVAECAALVRIVDVNRATLALYGAKSKDDLLQNLALVFCDESYDHFREELTCIAEGKTNFDWEGVNQGLDGRRLHVSMRWLVAPGYEADLSKVLVSIIDITARKQAEATLRLQGAALEATANGIVITDRDGTIEWINPAFAALTGYSAQESIGKNPRDLVKSGLHDQAFYKDLWDTILAGKTWRGEFINRRKDGSLYSEEEIITPLTDASGRVTHFIGVKQDISERKQAQERLRSLKEFNEGIVQNMVEGIVITDAQGAITYMNPALATLLGYASEELIGQPWLAFVQPDQQAMARAADERRALGQTDRYEVGLVRKSGAPLWVMIGGSPRFDPQTGEFIGTIGVITDITARKEAEAELRRRADELAALYETTRDLASQQDLLPLLHTITERACALLHAPGGGIYLYDAARNDLEMVIAIGVSVPLGARLRMGEGMAGRVAQSRQPLIVDDYSAWEGRAQQYKDIPFRAVIQAPMLYAGELIGVLVVEEVGDSERKFTEVDLNLLIPFANQAAVAVQNARLFEEMRQRVTELEVLYESGLALGGLLEPHAIGQKVVAILTERLDWHHAVVRLRQPESDELEVIGYGAPGLRPDRYQDEIRRLNGLIQRIGQGMTGWVVQHGQTVRCDNLPEDPRYVETYPGIRSGLYAPMKAGEETLGAIGVESETSAAFDADDERLLTTLASQAAAAIQTARQFETTRRRAVELETLNRISIALRAVVQWDEMLAIVLEETLNALGTAHGSINLWNEAAQELHKVIARGWLSVVTESPIKSGEGIFGSVFASGKMHLSQEFASDPLTRDATRAQLPAGWGGACVPINSPEQTLGVLLVAIPKGRAFSKGQMRLLNTIAEMTGAALHRVALHQQTVRRLEDLQSLHMVDQAISSSFDLRPVLEIVISQAMSRLGVDAASLLLFDPLTQTLEYATGRGFYNPGAPRPPMRFGQGLAGRAVMERNLLHASNLGGALDAGLPKEENFEEYYVAPLVAKGEIKGVLEVFHRGTLLLDKERLEFLETLAGQAAIAIDNNHLFDGLQRANLDLAVAYDATIEGWSRALDLRDEETEGHTQRVTTLTLQLAQTFGLSGADLNHIRRGALLHDIGKMGIPDSILLKPGPLTEEEWVIMRQHPHLAYELLAPISYLRPALDIPWCHHEKWDGTGYPRQLKEEQIPLAARIFAVVDVYDALTSDRPYRKAWSKDETLQYIAEQSGAHFDPKVVERFMQVIAEQA
jgi:PAS domain S-box-containing protein/putative nucleotidyltransferase with HDIG domain